MLGIVIAVAGGFGTAVGIYSLPDPQTAFVTASVYEDVNQHAQAQFENSDDGGGSVFFEVDIVRGALVAADAYATTHSHGASSARFLGTTFDARRDVCVFDSEQGDVCDFKVWSAQLPLNAVDFDPLMQSAHFSGTIDGCHFDIVWKTSGKIAPFEAISPSQTLQPWNVTAGASAYAVLAKDGTTADVSACFGTLKHIPGHLSEGLQHSVEKGAAGMLPQS
jgi:hypothetical protein